VAASSVKTPNTSGFTSGPIGGIMRIGIWPGVLARRRQPTERAMWMLVLVSLAANTGGVHSNVQTIHFPDQPACERAASILDSISLTAPGGTNGRLITTAKCIQAG
jgi:hypothetical protein